MFFVCQFPEVTISNYEFRVLPEWVGVIGWWIRWLRNRHFRITPPTPAEPSLPGLAPTQGILPGVPRVDGFHGLRDRWWLTVSRLDRHEGDRLP